MTRPCSPVSTCSRGTSRTTRTWRRWAGPRISSRSASGRRCTTRSRSPPATCPRAAAVYADDAYVVRAFSEETVALVPSLRAWVTNEYEHNGLRADGARILDRLIGMARGTVS